MAKQIITNTVGKPIFVDGRLLTPGMSIEVDIPDADVTDPTAAPERVATEPAEPTDEERLVAAVKAKGK